MSRYVRLVLTIVAIAIVGGASYTAGYLSGVHAYTASSSTLPAASATPGPRPEQFKVFWEAWDLVQKEFYNPAALDQTEMVYGAIKGMLGSLGDVHTSFASPAMSQIAEDDMRGSFDGIGVTVEMKDGLLTVVAPLDSSPGEAAGIKPGDVIVKVDGRDTAGLTLLEAVALIRGPRGTVVELTIQRANQPEPLVVKVKRAEIKVESVKTKMLEGDIGYVKIGSFSEPTANLLVQRLRSLMQQKPKALILDLRNNPGGLLSSAVDVASQFMADGVVLYQQTRSEEKQAHYVKNGGLATNVPLLVLVNKGSASASEIVAGALQDSGRARLVGEPTFGKDTVQNVHHLSDNSTVRVTIARWFTPKEQDIREKGLQPDILVPLTEQDHAARRDPQLDRALEHLRQLSATGG